MHKFKLKQSKNDEKKHLRTLEKRSNRQASSKGMGPPQKAWNVSKLTSFFQDLSSKGISKTLSKNASRLGRIVRQTMAETKQEEYVKQIKSANRWPRQSRWLTRFVQKPPKVIIERPYVIPFVGMTHLIDPLHKEEPSLTLMVGIRHIKYQP